MLGFPNKLGTIVKEIAIWEIQKEAENKPKNRTFAMLVKQFWFEKIYTYAIIFVRDKDLQKGVQTPPKTSQVC